MDGIPSPDFSSELSSLGSRSPSPPSELLKKHIPYHSPPSSQQSPRGTPGPDTTSSNCASSAEDEDSRPAKRRRVTPTMPRETKRLDLEELNTNPDPVQQAELDRLLKALRKNRKIVVVAGAGISVSAGIPDFRSSGGLFNSLKAQHNLKGSGKQLFDAAVYRDSSSTSSFHDMVRSLSGLTKSAKPTPFHHLLARLAHEGRLLRLYSQNVDGIDTALEPLATKVPLPAKGPWPKTIQLHGGLEKMICTKCQHLSDFKADLFDGPTPPECEQCKQTDFARTEVAGKRSHGIGRLRPRMVLYNEHNPDDEAIGAVTKADLRRRPDAIIVVGTTLKIPGVKRIVREMCSIVRNHRDGLAVWINNDPEPTAKEFENSWDLIIKGTCDEIADHAAMRKWDDEDVGDSRVVTEEEAKSARESGEPQVIVQTPVKALKVKDVEGLLTPAHTPRGDDFAADNDVKPNDAKAAAGPRIVLNFGKTQKELLSGSKGSDGQSAPKKQGKVAAGTKPRATKKTDPGKAGSKKTALPKKKAQDDTGNATIPFKVAKSTVSANAPEGEKMTNAAVLSADVLVKPDLSRTPHISQGPDGYQHQLAQETVPKDTVGVSTPKKQIIEKPPVSPFTGNRMREPLSPSKDNIRPFYPRLFPNLAKASEQ